MDTKGLEEDLKQRMVAHGEWDRILRLLTDRLGASGWEETVRDNAARQARSMDPLNLDKLLTAMSPSAQDSVPADIRTEVEGLIREYLERNIE